MPCAGAGRPPRRVRSARRSGTGGWVGGRPRSGGERSARPMATSPDRRRAPVHGNLLGMTRPECRSSATASLLAPGSSPSSRLPTCRQWPLGSGSPVTVARPRRILTGFLARRAGRSQGSRSRASGQPEPPGGPGATLRSGLPGPPGGGREPEVGGVGDPSGGDGVATGVCRPDLQQPYPDRRREATAPLEGPGRGPRTDALDVEGAEDAAQGLTLHASGRRRPPRLAEPLGASPIASVVALPATTGLRPGPVPEATAAVGVRADGHGDVGAWPPRTRAAPPGEAEVEGGVDGRRPVPRSRGRSRSFHRSSCRRWARVSPGRSSRGRRRAPSTIGPLWPGRAVRTRPGPALDRRAGGGEGCRPPANRHGQMATNVQLSLSWMCALVADRHPVCARRVVCDSILLGSPSSATLLQHKAHARSWILMGNSYLVHRSRTLLGRSNHELQRRGPSSGDDGVAGLGRTCPRAHRARPAAGRPGVDGRRPVPSRRSARARR